VVSEPDPATGAVVTAKLESRSPHYRISYSVEMPDGSQFSGSEEITGTTVSLRGLGMPAPSLFKYNAAGGAYAAKLAGLITSELIPGIIGRSRIRAYGALDLQDDAGNMGKLELARNGQASVSVTGPDGSVITRQMSFVAPPASK